MELNEIRNKINDVDREITRLFETRMELVSEVADYKAKNNLPIFDGSREREIIARITENQSDEMAGYTKVLFTTLFDLSRSYQNRNWFLNSGTANDIKNAIANTPQLFPKSAVVACQGIEGANSQLACDRIFSRPKIMYMNSFESVFSAVDKGLCRYGILPIENSLYGSVTEVYDLMKKYKFYIAKSVKVRINHTLLAKSGTKISDLKEIFSHEQALGQCSEFLKSLCGVKITPCENTAVAAKMVFESDRHDIAAISSKSCAELYNLVPICSDIQNSDNNYTRFICISKSMEIYPGSNKISLMFTIPHRPGSLYGIISRFSALGVNLTKLESRPISGTDFEFMFYIDLDASIYSDEILNLICGMSAGPEYFAFLGNYSEI